MQYAGFWWRLLAYFIDGILIGIALWIVMMPFGGMVPAPVVDPTTGAVTPGEANPIGSLLNLVISWAYFAGLESSNWQATVGKKVLGLKVTDLNGARISFGRATGRFFSKILSALILCIGFIMVAFTEKKQGLHDMIAKTLVVKA